MRAVILSNCTGSLVPLRLMTYMIATCNSDAKNLGNQVLLGRSSRWASASIQRVETAHDNQKYKSYQLEEHNCLQ